jgi:hypothetical protein
VGQQEGAGVSGANRMRIYKGKQAALVSKTEGEKNHSTAGIEPRMKHEVPATAKDKN